MRAAFSNAGQLCVATERIYVVEPLFEPFIRAFVARTRGIRLGNAPDFDHDMGSLLNHDQLERVRAHVEDARSKGATVRTGGRHREDLGEVRGAYHLTRRTSEMDATPGDVRSVDVTGG